MKQGYFKQMATRFVHWLLPDRTKRMLLIVGVVSKVLDLSHRDNSKEIMEILNSKFNLANETNAMYFAVEVSRLLWRDLQLQKRTLVEKVDILADEIIARIPESLDYKQDREKLKEEIIDALNFTIKYQQV